MMLQREQLLTQLREIIDQADSILITGQDNPDGDSLGSELALFEILTQHRQRVTPTRAPELVICNDAPPPAQYSGLPHIAQIVAAPTICDRRFDVGFVLDAGTDRIGQVLPILQRCRQIITIDHHQSRASGIEHLAWIEPTISSVAEMIAGFFEHPAWQVTLTPTIAANLYAGLIYDTGVFRYPNTTPRTLQIAAQLIATGIDFAVIVEKVLLEKSFAAMRLLSATLGTLQTAAQGQIIWARITLAMLAQTQARADEDEGIISQYAFTTGTKVAVLFKERGPHETKVSFRARGALDVGAFARQMSSKGGGHHRAAGCTLPLALPDAENMVIAALNQIFAAIE